MELRQLRYFLKAKELLNFTEAANALYISQSTLSQQIKQLEDQLNAPLFNRIGKRISLTEAGNLFAEYAQQSVNRANDGLLLLNDLNNLKTGKINIGVTYALRNVLTNTLVIFARLYPQVKVDIVFGTSDELIEKLENASLDLVLSFRGEGEDPRFIHKILFSSPMTLVVSKTSAFAKLKSVAVDELADLTFAMPANGYSTVQFISRVFESKGIKPNITIEINDIPTLLSIVKSGQWCTILTEISVDDSELVTIPIKGKNMSRNAMGIWLRDAYPKKAMLAFFELLEKENWL